MTLKEIVYLVLDELKLTSDDSLFNEEHVRFLINKYRIFLLKQYYDKNPNKKISESNYQTIQVSLELIEDDSEYGCGRTYLKSTEELPNISELGTVKIYPIGCKFSIKIAYISSDRMKFIGHNKWLKNIIYCTTAEDYLYLTSPCGDFENLTSVRVRGLFEDAEKAINLSENTICDILDMEYPLEAELIPMLVQSVVQELSPKTVTPEDAENNASDDKSNLANYIARNQKQNPR